MFLGIVLHARFGLSDFPVDSSLLACAYSGLKAWRVPASLILNRLLILMKGINMPQLKRATPSSKNNEMQGEGNYTAAKEYDDATQAFIKSGKVKDAAKNAAPRNAAEAREMLEAEEKRARACQARFKAGAGKA